MICHKCGKENVEGAKYCRYCGSWLAGDDVGDAPMAVAEKPSLSVPEVDVKLTKVSTDKSGKRNPRRIIVVLLFVVVNLFGYYCLYLPSKAAVEYSRCCYPFAEKTYLRSSQVTDVTDNILCVLPYGTELTLYENSNGWAYVKSPDGQEGYVVSDYLMNKKDFAILGSIWGDTDSRTVISASRYRRALLNYYKCNKLIGYVDEDVWDDIFPREDLSDYESGWQVFCKPNNSRYNYVFYERLTNPNSKYADFCVILRNERYGERKFVLFSFDDDETPHIVSSADTKYRGLIKRVYGDVFDGFMVDYSAE